MKQFIFLFIFFALGKPVFCQTDSTIVYLNKEGKYTTSADSAVVYGVFTKNGNLWHAKSYHSSNKAFQSEGDYAELNFDKPIGTFKNYTEKGELDNVVIYSAPGVRQEATWYYPNGKKKANLIVDKNGSKKETGWEPNGTEIKDYIIQKAALFKGGDAAWKRYLEKHLDAKVAVTSGAPAGTHTVLVSFVVTKAGYVSEVKAVSVPAKCKACATEAIRVIQESPEWEPAIQYNKPVNFRQLQGISFSVQEETKKGRSK